MPNFAIMRTAKVKSVASLANLEKHCSREKMPTNADQERSKMNQTIIHDSLSLPERFAQMTKGQKIRKNAVMGVEVMLTASPDSIKDIKTLGDWTNANRFWLEKEFGKGNVCRMWLHMDETTPHIHAVVIPLDQNGKLNCRAFLGGADKLSRLQDSYANAMQPFALERGIKGSKAHHQTIKEFYRSLEHTANNQLPEPQEKKTLFGTKMESAQEYKDRADQLYKQQGMEVLHLREDLRKEKERNQTRKLQDYRLQMQVKELNTYKTKATAWDALETGLNHLSDKTHATSLKTELNSIISSQREKQNTSHNRTAQRQNEERTR